MLDLNKSRNSILFDFDSIVDLKIGAVFVISKYYFRSDFVNKRFVGNKEDFLKMCHIYEENDIFKSCFLGEAVKSSDNLYRELLQKYEKEVIKMAPQTTSVKYIKMAQYAGDHAVKCTVLCKSENEKQYIMRVLPNTPIKMLPTDRRLTNEDVERYSRIVVADWQDTIERYKDITGKDFLILNYRENFTPESYSNLNPALIIALGDLNSIHFCNAYDKIEKPEG